MTTTNKEPEGIDKILADAARMQAEDAEKKRAPEAKSEAAAAAPAKEEPAKVAAPAAPAKEEPAPEAKPTQDAAKLDKAIDAIEDDTDDVKADDKGNVTLPFKAFERRIQRAGRAHLKAIFGTDDRAEILKMKKDYEDLIAARETERKAKLSEIERIKEEKSRAEARAQALEERETARQEAADAEAEEKRVNQIAAKYVDTDAFEFAHYKFAKHLARKTKDELAEYDDAKVEAWYKAFAAKHPKYAAAAAEAKADEKPKAKVGLNVGAAPPAKPSTKNAVENTKTPRPGQANSMSDAEWQDYKRKNNISY